jgi:hypothetical protein
MLRRLAAAAVIVSCLLFSTSEAGSGNSSPPASWKVPFAQPDYQSQSASSKLSTLMQKLRATEGSSGSYPGSDLLGIFSDHTSMETSLAFESDELPNGRIKYIHSVGTVAQVKFVSSGDHEYTGIFKGADAGIVRLSSALDQDPKAKYQGPQTTGKSLAPGFGLKFLRDGIKSCNLVAMYSVDGQSSHNFFSNIHTNQIGNPIGIPVQVLAQKFATAKSSDGWVGKVGLSDFGSAGQDGKTVPDPKFPFYLEFVPTSEVSSLFPDEYSGTYFADQLARLKSGTKLWEVRAFEKPGASPLTIGSLVMTSDMFKSQWGDEHLFFQHQGWPEDTKHHPEWLSDKSEWSVHYANAQAMTALQSEPIVNSMFTSPLYYPAYKAAETAANLAKPNLPYTMIETQMAKQARSSCPFAAQLVQRHQYQHVQVDKSLEKSLAQCSLAHAHQNKEDAWTEDELNKSN